MTPVDKHLDASLSNADAVPLKSAAQVARQRYEIPFIFPCPNPTELARAINAVIKRRATDLRPNQNKAGWPMRQRRSEEGLCVREGSPQTVVRLLSRL
ncbi:hypothetical protein LSAT2_031978 [Lamellibrachia satsuma]|nr:hypothetical protein LSAT2_031978 [Lamellibrachia satsuma]